VWIDSNGGSCTRQATPGSYQDAAACSSFAAAYTAANSGDTVGVRPGTYPAQKFAGGYQSTQARGTKTLTFRGDPGAIVRQINAGSPNLTYDGLDLDAGATKTSGPVFANGGGDNVTFRNGRIGNVVDEKGALVDGTNLVFENVTFHDVVIRTSGVHSECMFAEVPEKMIVRNSTFTNCAVMDIFFVWPDWWSPQPPAYGNVTLEDNYFGDPDGSCCGIYIGGTGPNGDRTARNWTIRHNHFEDSTMFGPMSGGVRCGNTGKVGDAWKQACS
jgi:hypothetical protein